MDDAASRGRPSDGLHALSSMRLLDDGNLADSLRRVATAGCELLADCVAASLTLVVARRPTTMASTNEVAAALDDAQYAADEGPCLQAARSERVVRLDSRQDSAWPDFRRAAQEHGILTTMSVPVVIPDPGICAGINLYAELDDAFTAVDEDLASAFAVQAAGLISNAHAYWTAFELTHNLAAAMEHRGVIEQAKGILMAADGCSPDEAFETLRIRSQAQNRKLRDIAAEIVADTQSDRPAANG